MGKGRIARQKKSCACLKEEVMKSTFTAFVVAASGLALFLSIQDSRAGNSVTSVQINRQQPAKAMPLRTPAPPPPMPHVSASMAWKKAHHCHYQ
jgi:hypothetical protein